MQRPFAMSNGLHAASAPTTTATGNTAGETGGAAPQSQTVGVRRDFSYVPQFLPALTQVGGLKQPPRG